MGSDLLLECPRLHTLRLVSSCLVARVGLAACAQLRTLDFSSCDFEEAEEEWLGPELRHAQGLTLLCMDSCMLKDIPDETRSMSALRQLSVADNHISTLPPMLPPLEFLDLTACDFDEVPQVPAKVTSLTRLDLGRQSEDCQLTHTLLPLLQRNPGLRELTIGGSKRWSFESLEYVSEAWQWLDAQDREVDFCYELDRDIALAGAQ